MRYSSLNSSDRKLIDEVATLWVADGGDADGLVWCLDAIKERITEIKAEEAEREKSANDQAH